MTQETLMTEQATNTSEGQVASQSAVGDPSQAQAAQGGEQAAQEQQASKEQAAEGQKPESDKSEGDTGKPQGAPEKYEFKQPEGTEISSEVLGAFSEVAKDLNLSQDAAQKILDKVTPAMQARQAEVIETAKTQWADSARTDKEFGGDKLNENLAVAKKVLDTFGTPELRSLLNESGLGNHPEVIRMMYRAGKAISEDGFVSGGRVSASDDPAKRLFPNQT